MSTVATPRSAAEMVPLVELTGIRTYALSGRVLEGLDAPTTPDAEALPEVGIMLHPEWIETRMRMTVRSASAEFHAEIGVRYEFRQPLNLWADVVQEFVVRVGVMAAYPFVREAIYTTAIRMGEDAPVLGLVRAGEFEISQLEGPQFIASNAPATAASLAREFGLSVDDARDVLSVLDLAAASQGSRKLRDGDVQTARSALAHYTQSAHESS